jgi:hypothetical protein
MKQTKNNDIVAEIISSLKNYNEHYQEGSWENFVVKWKKKKRKSHIIYWTEGIAALLVIGFISFTLFQTRQETQTKLSHKVETGINPEEKENRTRDNQTIQRKDSIPFLTMIEKIEAKSADHPNLQEQFACDSLKLSSNHAPETIKSATMHNEAEKTAETDSTKSSNSRKGNTLPTIKKEWKKSKTTVESKEKKFSLGIALDGSTNSTPSTSTMSYAVRIENEIKLNQKLSIITGIGLSNYKLNYPLNEGTFSPEDPISSNVELLCLDIPVNLKVNLLKMGERDIFVTGGVSTLAFIREKYRDEYFFDEPTVNTIHLQNINFSGQLNVSCGYQWQASGKIHFTVEAYTKIPLYKLAEKNLHFYQSGLSFKISK